MSLINKKILPPTPIYSNTSKPVIMTRDNTHNITLMKNNKNIEFSNTEKKTHKTKNFIVLYNGFPLKNKTFNLTIQNASDSTQKVTLPIFKTDNNGILSLLVRPAFNQEGLFDAQASGYQPLKFSNRLGFVVKNNTGYNKKNIFYRTNYIAKYIDLGISVHFLREMIKKSQTGDASLDASQNQVVQNWVHVFYNTNNDISDDYKKFNTHTERTAKALKYTDYGCNTLTVTGIAGLITGASIATAGLAPLVVAGIGGGVMASGTSGSIVDKYMAQQTPDISRLRDTQKSAQENLKSE